MKKIDFYSLDGHILKTFLILLEESSVSRAADHLDLTQSAVSHTLAKLRKVLGDPLFVRSGSGVTPTETALALKIPVQEVLDGLKALTERRSFDPKTERMHFVVAANDIQRDLLFPHLFKKAHAEGIDVTFEFKPSGVPSVSLLRDAKCDLMITPKPPDAPDLIRQKLFESGWKCFYDGSVRRPPVTIEDYLSSDHVGVHFALGGSADDVLEAYHLPYKPKPTISVSNFAGIPAFIRGTGMLTTQAEQMHRETLKSLDMADLPFETENVSVAMIWHARSTNDPSHRWLRGQIVEQVARTGLK